MAGVQFYEAIVIDGAPDATLPGHIKVKIPELFGMDEAVPVLIPPLFPGWHAGGWHSVPSHINPDDPEETEGVRVMILHLGRMSFRWIGSSQEWSFITDNPGTKCGARSGDGRHYITLDNEGGLVIQVGSDTRTTKNFIKLGPDDILQIANAAGATFMMSPTQVMAINAQGDLFIMDDNAVAMVHRGGIASVSVRSGDLAVVAGTFVQLNGGSIELGGGVIPPVHPYPLTLAILADLSLLCADVQAIGLAIPTMAPYTATNAAAMIAKIATSLSAGAPYLSTRIYGD